nr:DUF3841 domain-containing protein [Sedimentibacter sp.]
MTVDLCESNDKVKLWTRQHKNVITELEKHGVYRVKKEYIMGKMDTISDYYLDLYEWYGKHADKIVPRPKGVTYPIWLSTSSDVMLQPTEDEERHNEELKKYGITSESSLITGNKGNFYPLLKNKIIKSWERLFDSFEEEGIHTQATIWEIKKEWVVDIIYE